PAQSHVYTTDFQPVLVLESDVDTFDTTVHRITFDQGAVAVWVIQREVRVQAVDVVAAVDHRRGCQYSDGVGDLRLVPVNGTGDAVEQLVGEGRTEGQTEGPGIPLLVLQVRVTHHQGAAAAHVPLVGIRVEVRGVIAAPGIDLRSTELLQLGAGGRIRGVGVVQR